MSIPRAYSPYAQAAAELLGSQIQLGRRQRRMTESNLAERAGISRATLRKIEQGELGVRLGLVFEVASLVGVALFVEDRVGLNDEISRTRDKLALLPRQIKPRRNVTDDF